MKVKWKQQEKMFVATLVGLLLIEKTGFVIQKISHDSDKKILDFFGEFLATFFTQIAPLIFLLLCYLGIIKYLVPVIDSLYSNKTIKEFGAKILRLSCWLLLFSYLLGPVNNFLLYYLGISYEDFSSDAFYHPQPFRNIFGGIGTSFSIVLLYSVYTLFRKLIIELICKRTARANYRIQILNVVTTFLFLFLIVAYYFQLFIGIEFLRSLPNPPMVIFTTAYSQHAVESFELDAIDYLLKPFSIARFLKACNKAQEQLTLRKNTTSTNRLPSVFIKTGYERIKVDLEELLFVESTGNYMKFVFSNQQILPRMTMQEVNKLLPTSAFIRIHRSFIVAKKSITKIDKKYIWIGERALPIGKQYMDDVKMI